MTIWRRHLPLSRRALSPSPHLLARQSFRHGFSSSNDASKESKDPPPAPTPVNDTTALQSPWMTYLTDARDRLRVWSELNGILLRERANSFSTAASTSLSHLGGKLNSVTGYNEIEVLKKRVVEKEAQITSTRQAAREAKQAYEQAVALRSTCQREVNDLLQRKSSWNDADVMRFTALVRQDHLNEQSETRAKEQAALAEDAVEREFQELMKSILNRYHEEQIWSDKIRSASTYGSLMALGINLLVFLLAIVIVEPWKRRKLAETFNMRIEEISAENRAMIDAGMRDLAQHFEKQEKVLSQIADASIAPAAPLDHELVSPTPENDHPETEPEKSTKAARDRELITAGIAGAVGGGILALLAGRLW